MFLKSVEKGGLEVNETVEKNVYFHSHPLWHCISFEYEFKCGFGLNYKHHLFCFNLHLGSDNRVCKI